MSPVYRSREKCTLGDESEQTSDDYVRLQRGGPGNSRGGVVLSPHASRKYPSFIGGAFHFTIMLPIIRSTGIDCDGVYLSVLGHW